MGHWQIPLLAKLVTGLRAFFLEKKMNIVLDKEDLEACKKDGDSGRGSGEGEGRGNGIVGKTG